MRLTVLVAARPSLLRLIEHLLRDSPDLRVLGHRGSARALPRRAARASASVVVASGRHLGRECAAALEGVRRSSPRSKLVLLRVRDDHILRAADAELEEDALVRSLLPTVRRLAARPASPHRRSAG
jgi:DNA-binding NarL/FixJ family response regulator